MRGAFGPSGFEDGERSVGTTGAKRATEAGGEVLIVAGAEAKLLKPRTHRVRPPTPRLSCPSLLFLWALVRCLTRQSGAERIARGQEP